MKSPQKVALVVPALPGHAFGAEKLISELHAALRRRCDAALISVRTDETSWTGVEESYLRCYDLDLSKYDLVVSTKAPTFMVRHPKHVCWLVHQMRVFYDRFEEEYGGLTGEDLAQKKRQQSQIRILDSHGFATARRIFTIGHEVSRRLKLYNNYDSEPLHPPLINTGFHCGGQDYFLLPGRLHRWKRVSLAIEGFKRARTNRKLLITGAGEDAQSARGTAAGDPRVEFLGYVNPKQLLELYANSLAVLFVPKDEDFGYVCLEAMSSGKPVITCIDSGEPTSFVRNEENGLVVAPEREQLTRAIERLAEQPEQARRLGAQAQQDVPTGSWDEVCEKLLAPQRPASREQLQTSPAANGSRRLRVLVADNQVLDPPVGGGRVRIYELYRHMADLGPEITYVGAYDWPGPAFRDQMLSQRFREVVTPLTQTHFRLDSWVSRLAARRVTIDVTIPRLLRFSPRFRRLANEHGETADVIIISHPWVFPYVKRRHGQLLIYDAHNCEFDVKSQILKGALAASLLTHEVKLLESKLCTQADLIFVCSEEDRQTFQELYGTAGEKMVVIPNGVDVNAIEPATECSRLAARRHMKIEGSDPVLMFIGSGYRPNAEAAEFIVKNLAPEFPKCTFLIAGGVRDSVAPASLDSTANVRWTGVVTASERKLCYDAADIALNPMFSGSGTNLKMLDYFAAGLPVVSTPAGARGLRAGPQECTICEADEFSENIAALLESGERRRLIGSKARRLAENRYSWQEIARSALQAIEARLEGTKTHAAPRPA